VCMRRACSRRCFSRELISGERGGWCTSTMRVLGGIRISIKLAGCEGARTNTRVPRPYTIVRADRVSNDHRRMCARTWIGLYKDSSATEK
jgi:hypothetical protein